MKTPASKPAALVITRNLPPLVGGMERLLWHIVNELHADWRVHVVGPTSCSAHLPHDVTADEVTIRPMYRYLLSSKLAAIGAAMRLHPSLVFAGSGLTAPMAWLASRLVGAHCVVYLHGLDVEARHPVYRWFWKPFFRRCDRVLVNSHFTRQLALDAGIAETRITILHPGVELPDIGDAAQQRASFRARHSLDDNLLMLYVGRITARKGLASFVQNCLPAIVKEHPMAKLVVIGDEPANALLKSAGERTKIMETLKAAKLENCVMFLGELAHDAPELNAAYFAADVSIFPVEERPYDNEGFGMVAIEAAAHGLPTIAFAVGGIRDAIADGLSGSLIPAGEPHTFIRAVNDHLSEPAERKAARMDEIRAFASEFAWPVFGHRLRQLCRFEQNS